MFLELLKCYCYKLRKYTNFISSPIQSIFVQFLLKRTHLKGKDVYFLAIMASKGWGQRKKHDGLQNLELEGQISQNVSPQIFFFRKQKKPKKSSSFRWCFENLLFFCFWSSKLPKTVFFLKLLQKKLKIGPKSKSVNSKSCFKLNILFHTTFFSSFGLVWYGLVIVFWCMHGLKGGILTCEGSF